MSTLGPSVVLFGGMATIPCQSAQCVLNDTWKFDGTTWTQVTTAHRPPGVAFAPHVMATLP